LPIAGKGFSSQLKMHYRPGKGDGSVQAGEACYLSTIALSVVICLFYVLPVGVLNDDDDHDDDDDDDNSHHLRRQPYICG